MRRRITIILTITLLLMLAPMPRAASAWSNKEHIQLTRLAAMLLIEDPGTPKAMKAWLRSGTPGLRASMDEERAYFMTARVGIIPRDVEGVAFWATAPDMAALIDRDKQPIEPFGVDERLMHFIDVELFNPDESKRAYQPDLSSKPPMSAIPRDMSDERFKRAGMLPFRVEQSYHRMVEMIRQGRLNDKPGQYPRDEHAAKWAGYVAHYAQDNTQPHHATIDYKSASYFPGYGRRAPNVHTEVEYRMCDDEFEDYAELRAEFWPLFVKALDEFEDPVKTNDPWESTVEIALNSYDALPLIGQAGTNATDENGELDTEKFFRHRGPCFGTDMSVMEMKARQQAWAVKRTQRLWRQAWETATRNE